MPAIDAEQETYDVAVLGGGNAGLCAALTAREAGARAIVVESAPRHFRGGNSREYHHGDAVRFAWSSSER